MHSGRACAPGAVGGWIRRQRAFETERAVKRTGAPAEAIVGDLLARLALAAAPQSSR